MHTKHSFLALAAVLSLLAATAPAQNSPSLGEIARQQRLKKQQSNAAPVKVVTNDEIPEHPNSAPQSADHPVRSRQAHSPSVNASAEQLKSRIRNQMSQIASLQNRIDETVKSIPLAPVTCSNGCPHWNERENSKQRQIERLQAQLQEEKKHLEEMEEAARKQGYGSSIYEP
jgi:predicted RNase H-like nuclease (RuvC/YqgF family)